MLIFNFKAVLYEGFWEILLQKSLLPVALSFSVIDTFIFARIGIVVLSYPFSIDAGVDWPEMGQ